MFIEPQMGGPKQERSGWIEVVCGCMFSGKTEELIRRLNRAVIAGQKVKVFKPALDTRYHLEKIVSHNNNEIPSASVKEPGDILGLAEDSEVIGIDECQFFDENIVKVCNALANKGRRVIVAGLDMDFEGKPFGPMPYLLAVAEFVTKLHAICKHTGELASFSFRITEARDRVLLGESNHYEARSRSAFVKGMKKKS